MNLVELMYAFTDWIWGPPLLILIAILAVYLTARLKGFQFRYFGHVLKNTLFKIFKPSEGEGTVSPFQATCTALAATLGTGNIAGVAVAIAAGGPGAVFWMWIAAILGFIVKFAEVTLGVAYREKDPETGEWNGGFYWFIKNGLGKKFTWLATFLAVIFAFCMAVDPAIQSNSVVEAMKIAFEVKGWVIGVILAVLTALVVFGGLKSVANFAEKVVPIMAVIYVIGSLVAIFMNAGEIPGVFGRIFKEAFTGSSATGGFAGSTVMMAIRWGMARGIYSNEAGIATAPLVHSSAVTDHPCRQGLWGIFEVFVDTIVVCTMTALVILTSGVWDSGVTSTGLTATAFGSLFGSTVAGGIFVSIIISLFSFTSGVGCAYYGSVALKALGAKGNVIRAYCIICCISTFLGCIGSSDFLWYSFDFILGIVTIVNLIALFLLRKQIVALVNDYIVRLKNDDFDKSPEESVKKLNIWKEDTE